MIDWQVVIDWAIGIITVITILAFMSGSELHRISADIRAEYRVNLYYAIKTYKYESYREWFENQSKIAQWFIVNP